ncbi:MAG: acetoacetate decarboxylase family protein [Chloroflexota bacterium]
MPYKFQPDQMYRMPTHFGPRTGPRRGPDGRKFECIDNPKSLTISASFLSNADQLNELLPHRFELNGEPIVTVYVTYMTEIEWLAGRGYNVLGVTIPARFNGEVNQVQGAFLTVLWENLTDPIITGREELGFSKIYCEIPPATVLRGDYHFMASWMGFKFLDVNVTNLKQQTPEEIAALGKNNASDGTLHYKYMPRTGEWGTADISYPVLTPATGGNGVIQERWVGDGHIQFHPARWEDMPTQYNIVNVLHGLEIKEFRGGSVARSVGGKDLSDQCILK